MHRIRSSAVTSTTTCFLLLLIPSFLLIHNAIATSDDCQDGQTCTNPDILLTYTSIFQSATDRYLDYLDRAPLVTKSLTSAVVSGLGDLLAQVYLRQPISPHRIFTVAVEGLFVSGPILHFAYSFLDTIFFVNVWWTTAVTVVLDLLILDSFFVATLMVISGLLQGKHVIHELRHFWWPACQVSWWSSLALVPIQWINFAMVPVQFRVLVTNLEDVLWNAAVSYTAHKFR